MTKFTAALILAAMLAACGQGAQRDGGGASASNEACTLLADTTPLFGASADVVGYAGLEGMAATCEFASADGARGGEIILYTTQSLGAVTPDAQLAEVLEKWDSQTETALALVEALGESARIATDLPGYQTHIAFRKGDTLILVAARSGADAITGEELARRMAQAINTAP